MSDQVLPDILAKILSRCEVETLASCRCVSKQWLAIIDSPHFTKLHIHRAMETHSSNLFEHKLNRSLYYGPLDSFCHRHMPLISQVYPFASIGSCNGLLCVYNLKTEAFCIFNPTTMKYLCLPGFLPPFDTNILAYGFGYDSLSDDYKIVRIAQKFDVNAMDNNNIGFLETEMVVGCVRSKALKVVKMPYFITDNLMGVLAAGTLHWIMCEYSCNMYKTKLLVGYDLGIDEFRELPLPEFEGQATCTFCIGLIGEWLCVSFKMYEDDKDVGFWAMKEYGVKESWTKLFSFRLDVPNVSYYRLLGLSESGNLVTMELDRNRLVCYDRERKSFRRFGWKTKDECMVCLRTMAPLPIDENGTSIIIQLLLSDEKNQSSDDQKKPSRKKKDKKGFLLSKGFKLKL
ncbi:F-box protein CPR1-like [Mercurialis annua]|uniref:F-box protein CPR1-like n=1 Tax=Mercurialis annua TaxID=3986 RepID=UPI00215F9D39|nr:F-box protein CPR1-like [Mercurialis annua]